MNREDGTEGQRGNEYWIAAIEDWPEGRERDAFYAGVRSTCIWGRWYRAFIAGVDDGVQSYDEDAESPPEPEGRNPNYDEGLLIGWEARRRQRARSVAREVKPGE